MIPLTVTASAALPALSTQAPLLVTAWLAASLLTVAPATVLVARPDPLELSAQVKLAVTSLLFQPAALAAGVRLPVITGLVLSIWIGPKLTLALLPALSLAVPLAIDVSAGLVAGTSCPRERPRHRAETTWSANQLLRGAGDVRQHFSG